LYVQWKVRNLVRGGVGNLVSREFGEGWSREFGEGWSREFGEGWSRELWNLKFHYGNEKTGISGKALRGRFFALFAPKRAFFRVFRPFYHYFHYGNEKSGISGNL
jgi:hypothetical protein